ncbi:hypothetical protein C8F04DRAFT_1192817 [Mycena alexandri]|uniref:Uncharacterized protein n=1 Tax=Mycena alexandri TaxID=1745969 RepID=A0AAD6WQR0_9AGAR|nr:hypothetical protein C8F04DRAFT_1195340 [Mycena alexandri]KAJ7024079.1 hypothetical protein C8F04DRAFT_1192817 [Mycena alexandri]
MPKNNHAEDLHLLDKKNHLLLGQQAWVEILKLVDVVTASHVHVCPFPVWQEPTTKLNEARLDEARAMMDGLSEGDLLLVVFSTIDKSLVVDGTRVPRDQDETLTGHSWAAVFVVGKAKEDGSRRRSYPTRERISGLGSRTAIGSTRSTTIVTPWWRFADPDFENTDEGLCNILTAKFVAEAAQTDFAIHKTDERWIEIPGHVGKEATAKHRATAKAKSGKTMRGWGKK